MTGIRHIFFDIGGVLGSNGWDREQRERAVSRFSLNAEDFQWRHEEVAGEWEEGRISLGEYLDIAVFYTDRPFSRQEFIDFMYSQSVPNDAAIRIARALCADPRFTLMTLNNESEELNIHRIETSASRRSSRHSSRPAGSACASRSANSTVAPSELPTPSRRAHCS
jgi:putative hydrolase of the HAD superfamily